MTAPERCTCPACELRRDIRGFRLRVVLAVVVALACLRAVAVALAELATPGTFAAGWSAVAVYGLVGALASLAVAGLEWSCAEILRDQLRAMLRAAARDGPPV